MIETKSPAVVDIESWNCTPGEADAVVTAVVTVLITTEESIEAGSPVVKVGTEEATVTERSTSPSSPTTSTRLHTFDASATVSCDDTYQITAEAHFIKKETATPVNVSCGPCTGSGECGE
jgi:hypothetical protein